MGPLGSAITAWIAGFGFVRPTNNEMMTPAPSTEMR